jgi:hypothetical protein
MFKRMFSSAPIKTFNCSNCRLYNPTTKLCKINKSPATDNRIDYNICGILAKRYWPLDKTNLIASHLYSDIGDTIGFFALTSFPCAIIWDLRIMGFTVLSALISNSYVDVSRKYKKLYLDDNDLSEHS